MPTYDYRCRKCGHEFAVFQGIKDRPKRSCPSCRGRLERLVTGGAGFILKGSGFYSTDYRGSEYKKAAEAEKKSSADQAPGDKKPGAKKEGKKPGTNKVRAESKEAAG